MNGVIGIRKYQGYWNGFLKVEPASAVEEGLIPRLYELQFWGIIIIPVKSLLKRT